MKTELIQPEGEFDSDYHYNRNKAINLDRVLNYLDFMRSKGIDVKISMISINHIIIHPLGKNGETLDVRVNVDTWSEQYGKKLMTKSGRKWLEKNWIFPRSSKTINDCSMGRHLI